MHSKTLVIRTAGTNCDYETVNAFKTCGAEQVDLVHINSLLSKEVNVMDYQILAIPGGFSYGDDVSAGKILANEIKYKLFDVIGKYIAAKRLIIGICNGFQVLVRTGLLPGFEGVDELEFTTLANNVSGKFEARWLHLRTEDSKCVFTRKNKPVIYLPIAHGEGNFVTLNKKVLEKIKENKQVVFRYCDRKGKVISFPENPNGSQEAIAGICNPDGNILGLMPHPERYMTRYNHPRWTREDLPEEGDGVFIFRNAVEFAKKYL